MYLWGIRSSPYVCVCTFIAYECVFYESDQHGQIRTSDHAVIRVHLGGLSLCWKGSAAESEPRISMQSAQLCVWVWKHVATSRVTVLGHSVWMKVIASGGWPAAETLCASVWICMKFRPFALYPFTTFTVYLYVHLFIYFITGLFIAFFSSLFLQKCSAGEHVKGKRLSKSSTVQGCRNGMRGKHIDFPLLVTIAYRYLKVLTL